MSSSDKQLKHVLPVIVLSQFLCTSVWFAGNTVIPELAKNLTIKASFLANIASSIQFGFISGTLVFAFLSIADRFSPSRVFLSGAAAAALANLGMVLPGVNASGLLLFRFVTGFSLAAIYPVGMKIAADYYREGLGRSLGFLVGALVLGTAFPHLVKGIGLHLPWQTVIYTTSALSLAGGLILWRWVPDGPFRKKASSFQPAAFTRGFADKEFRKAAFGYFGHMWELYTFWTFLPIMLSGYMTRHPENQINLSLYSFLIISSGSIACVAGGALSQKFGIKRIAFGSLCISGTCCLLVPIILNQESLTFLLLPLLFCWGMTVVADSPLFSTMVSHNAPATARGSSLTIVNCIGFAITIISIQLLGYLQSVYPSNYHYALLAIGPIAGLWAMSGKKNDTR